jgi:DNA polymerase elongation subunit (family B)
MQPSRDFQLLGAATGAGLRGEPWARLVGRRADGASVAVTVRGLRPYFYLKLEHGLLLPDCSPNQPLLDALVVDLNRHLNSRCRSDQKPVTAYESHDIGYALVSSATLVQRHDFYGFSARKHHYARLTFASLGAHREARWALGAPAGSAKAGPPLRSHVLERVWPARAEDLARAYRRADNVRRKGLTFTLAEANIEFHDQVMDELSLKPGCWCTPGPALRNACSFDDHKADRVATTLSLTAEARLDGAALRAALAPAEVSRAAPVRVLAWDLEVFCEPLGDGAMRFYDGDQEGAKLLCVSAVTYEYGVADSTKSVVFSLGEAPAAETQETATDGSALTVCWFGNDEHALFRAFFDYVRLKDPDVVTGWNTLSFDWPWLWKRAEALGLLADLHVMARWGVAVFDASDKARQVVTLPGREMHDMMLWVKKNRQLREYNLQFVATEYGLDGKDDVSYDQIAELFKTHEGRVKLAVYCALDSRLVCQLMQKPQLDPLGKTLAIAAITGVQPEHVLHRGSMHTLRLAMLRASHASDFVLSCPAREKEEAEVALTDAEDESRYQGGKVLNPITGFYRDPVVTLDFGSLYPSCMCELNICSSTRLSRAEAKYGGLDYTQPPAPDLTGVWYYGADRVARIHETADDAIEVYTFADKCTRVARYTDQLNESVTLPGGEVWALEDGGYRLRLRPEVAWHRADKDVLCMVDASVREGVIPMLERTLKLDRKAAKKKLAGAEERGDKAAATFFDNLQQGASQAHPLGNQFRAEL